MRQTAPGEQNPLCPIRVARAGILQVGQARYQQAPAPRIGLPSTLDARPSRPCPDIGGQIARPYLLSGRRITSGGAIRVNRQRVVRRVDRQLSCLALKSVCLQVGRVAGPNPSSLPKRRQYRIARLGAYGSTSSTSPPCMPLAMSRRRSAGEGLLRQARAGPRNEASNLRHPRQTVPAWYYAPRALSVARRVRRSDGDRHGVRGRHANRRGGRDRHLRGPPPGSAGRSPYRSSRPRLA